MKMESENSIRRLSFLSRLLRGVATNSGLGERGGKRVGLNLSLFCAVIRN